MLNYQHVTFLVFKFTTAQGLNVLDLTSADSVIITEAAAKKVEEVLA